MKLVSLITFIYIITISSYGQAQTFSGKVKDAETGTFLDSVKVKIVEDGLTVKTNAKGIFKLSVKDNKPKTVTFELEGYMFEELTKQLPGKIKIKLRAKKKSAATLRWEKYVANLPDCKAYKSVEIPDNPKWNITFKETDLKGDLVANYKYTRRDPSKVIKVGEKYYVWYSYKLSEYSNYFKGNHTTNLDACVFPWDYCDVYYATSTDGYSWKEEGPAVKRGKKGSFDDRSVFTPEIFAHDGKYYLVYQVVKSPYVERVKNNVAMAWADSPDGPWTKLDEPILRPTNNGVWKEGSISRFDAVKKGDFDSHKVHDPCLIYYKDKFYLYYKGERMGEENYCGQREIKWGVAIADKVTGPYVKSEYNPITNTGHEVSVWPYDEGIAIIQKLDGPEIGSIQYAKDGINFEIMGKASHVPDALGLYNPGKPFEKPTEGVSWGLAHTLAWYKIQGGWMFLRRFDLKK